jgi:DNA-binding transcriptional ArsR family regulator
MDQDRILFNNEAEIFGAMSHPARLEILDLLCDGEACVCHIQAMLDYRQAFISQHLNILRQAGLITSRKEGARLYYKLSDPGFLEMMDHARTFLQSIRKWQPELSNPAGLERQKKSCNCPQCSSDAENQVSTKREMEYA